MNLKLFCFPMCEDRGFDSQELDEFLEGKEVIDFQKDIVLYKNRPYYNLLVFYKSESPDYLPVPKTRKREKEVKLTDQERAVFEILREWRKKRAAELGSPPYIILNNEELAQVIKASPQTLAELGRIKGMGENKVKNYGREILEILRENTTPLPPKEEPEDGKT